MKLAYCTLGFGCLLALVTNIYKHGWSFGGFFLALALAILLFSLTTERKSRLRFYAALSAFGTLFCFVIYSAALR